MSAVSAAAAQAVEAGLPTLGVLGGGQLARMFVHAAQAMGYPTVVLDPDPASPAACVADASIAADYTDARALAQLAQRASAVTTEFENVPAAALATLAALRPVAPAADAVSICQDRAAEKAHFQRCGVPCAPFAVIASDADLAAAAALLPGILKTARLGYDGKGQITVDTPAALAAAWNELRRVTCVLERKLALKHELSAIVARGGDGAMVELPLQQNLHRDGILACTEVPATGVPAALAERALAWARELAAGMRYVGVLCVEFFVVDDGSADGALVANEMAPRPHNSGHHSIDSCDASQFELQVRTLAGLPLSPPRRHSAAVMLNLLGDLWFDLRTGRRSGADLGEREPPWPEVLALPGVHLHLYGKRQARRGRKMGHLTVTAPDLDAARAVAREAARRLGLDAAAHGGDDRAPVR